MDKPSPRTWSFDQIRHRFGASIVLGVASIVLIILSAILLIKSVQTSTPITFSSELESSPSGQSKQQKQDQYVVVDVEGAVAKPGIYRLAQGSRVEDALILAGGLVKNADVARIAQVMNRAAVVSDGAKLYFYPLSDSPDNIVRRDMTNDQVSAGSTAGVGMVSVNSSSQSRLEALDGIGPATAIKIINNRPYQTLEELVSKKVLSRSVLEKLKDQLTL